MVITRCILETKHSWFRRFGRKRSRGVWGTGGGVKPHNDFPFLWEQSLIYEGRLFLSKVHQKIIALNCFLQGGMNIVSKSSPLNFFWAGTLLVLFFSS